MKNKLKARLHGNSLSSIVLFDFDLPSIPDTNIKNDGTLAWMSSHVK
jgi:hypothetical protein